MSSIQHRKLKQHIEELRRDLLPDPFIDTGIYPNAAMVNTRTVAFVTFVHAEFEAYFEDRAAEVATSARDAFLNSAHVSRTVLCLLGFGAASGRAPGEKLAAIGQSQKELADWLEDADIKARVKVTGDDYLSHIRVGNNGIKEKDLAALLLPIGFKYFGFDPLLVSTFNDLGKARGGYVHRRKDTHVTANLDPKTQYRELAKLADDLEPIDREFDELLASARPLVVQAA